MENKNYNQITLIEKQNEEIKKLKSIILDMYAILKCANEEDNVKIINLTYGTLTLLIKNVMNLND
jgi:hypothetical protein